MNLRKYLKKVSIVSLFALTAVPVAGQDLLARQAPVDRRMKAVDTIVLKQTIIKENTESPAAQLYDDWSNRYAHRATQVPDSFRIDLRHFCMPTPSRVVTSNFGSRWGRQHKGLDIKVYIGDTIRAAFSGKVRVVKYEGGGYGKYIVIRHNNGLETIYGHLSKQLVVEDQTVRAGEPIGLGGNTGRSTGSHHHFENRFSALMFDFRNQDVVSDFYVYIESNYEHESAEATRLRGKVGNGGYNRDEVQGELANNSNANFDSSADMRYHKVKSGETLASIAEKRGVTIDTICKLNHITKGKAVRPGQILRYS